MLYVAFFKIKPGLTAGNTVDQNRAKPCRGMPFGLHGKLKSGKQNGNQVETPLYRGWVHIRKFRMD
jgi:hypothetical protein